jgi:hypothetical protein
MTGCPPAARHPVCLLSIGAILVAAVLGLAILPGTSRVDVPSPVAIDISVQPLHAFDLRDTARRQFGSLEFRGGLVLSSAYRHFGGLSAIRVTDEGGRFVSMTDKGWWLRGRIRYQGLQPSGIAEAEMAPMLGADGTPLYARGWYDTEALAQDGDALYVSIERVHQIVRFNYGRDGLLARGEPITVPRGMRSLPANKGIEGLAFVPDGLPLAGTLIAISERGLDRIGNIAAFLVGGPTPGTFSVKRTSDFDVTDAALLPGGDLLLLERKFNWTEGLDVRLRQIALTSIKPGAVVDGTVLWQADLRYEIDNLEGLSIHREPGGVTILTLVSDDNFSLVQRTLLLQFALTKQ